VLAVALPLAAVDLLWSGLSTTPSWAYHTRSPGWLALSMALVLSAFALARIPSDAVLVATGVMTGGVLGNALSAVSNGLRVPNPIVATAGNAVIAFNPADVFTTAGTLALTVALAVLLIRHRHLVETREDARAAVARLLGRS
jgi:lipoprotein signal peptidase